MPAPQALAAGLADPVFDAQTVFRRLLAALSRPGTVERLPMLARAPGPLSAPAAAILLSLADHETPVLLAGGADTDETRAWLAFHTGAPLVADPAAASFAACADPSALPALAGFAQGSAEYPDRSTTLLLDVPSLDGGPPLVLSGPGVKGEARFAPQALPPRFAEDWAENRARFPLGVDLVLCGPAEIAALPRTTRLRRA